VATPTHQGTCLPANRIDSHAQPLALALALHSIPLRQSSFRIGFHLSILVVVFCWQSVD
jgi:hypothetical protein